MTLLGTLFKRDTLRPHSTATLIWSFFLPSRLWTFQDLATMRDSGSKTYVGSAERAAPKQADGDRSYLLLLQGAQCTIPQFIRDDLSSGLSLSIAGFLSTRTHIYHPKHTRSQDWWTSLYAEQTPIPMPPSYPASTA